MGYGFIRTFIRILRRTFSRTCGLLMELTIGDRRYVLHVEQRAGGWVAHAQRPQDGARVSADWTGKSKDDVVWRLSRWLTWQVEHEVTLEALQEAERTYHRLIAGAAFSGVESEGAGLQQEALEAVDAARTRLDEVRASQPMDHEERP